MNHLLTALLILIAWPALAATEISFKEGDHPNGTLIQHEDGSNGLRIHSQGADKPIHLINVDGAPINEIQYVLSGQIKYEGVEKTSYLEMWNMFPDGGEYFTRTVSAEGPMGIILGSSDWRPFELPFAAGKRNEDGSLYKPHTLKLNLIMPGKGTVEVKNLILRNGGADLQTISPWWNNRVGGWMGGILGILAGMVGIGFALLVKRSKDSRVPQKFVYGTVSVSSIMVGIGAVAYFQGQPSEVFSPLVLVGGIIGAIMAAQLPSLKRQQAERELRHMQAMDS